MDTGLIIVFVILLFTGIYNGFLTPTTSPDRSKPGATAALTTHILDTTIGLPAPSVDVMLYHRNGTDNFEMIETGKTDMDGRSGFLVGNSLQKDMVYKLHFDTGTYFTKNNRTTFYPFVEIVFRVTNPSQHYHVPLLLSNYGYTTYRGS